MSIWDWLFPKYTLHWDFIQAGRHLKHSMEGWDSYSVVKEQEAKCNKSFGEGTHWVTDKNGKRV